MAFYDEVQALLGRLFRDDAFPYMAQADKLAIKEILTGMSGLAATGVCAEVHVGGAATATQTLAVAAESITAVIAWVTAGPFTPSELLQATTNYTHTADTDTLTWVTDESANTCLILYVPSKA